MQFTKFSLMLTVFGAYTESMGIGPKLKQIYYINSTVDFSLLFTAPGDIGEYHRRTSYLSHRRWDWLYYRSQV